MINKKSFDLSIQIILKVYLNKCNSKNILFFDSRIVSMRDISDYYADSIGSVYN